MAKNGTIAHMTHIPLCDFPHATPTPAVYDGKTRQGPWAYMCEDHFKSDGGTNGQLGLGLGQKLELITDEGDEPEDEPYDDEKDWDDYLEQYPHDEHIGLDLPGGYGS